MITLEARATSIEQNPIGLASTDDWERPDAVVSTAKQDAHDSFFLDTPDGEWLPTGRIAHEVHRSTHAFVGETALGRQVFLVAPGERTRPRNKNKIPLDAHFAYAHALETEYLRAVQTAEDQHLITHEEAVRQAGHMDSGAARVLRKPFRNQNQDVIHDGALIAAQATHMAIPAGIVGAGIALAAQRKDEYGRRFRNVGKVMYMTSAGITVGSLVISACTSVQSLPPQEVVVSMMPEQFSPTVDQAKQAVASWMGIRVPLSEGEFGVFPTQAIFEVDPMDSTGQKLKTLSLLNPDGRTTDPDLRYAMGLALVPSEKTGEAVELPFLVQLGKNGEALMLGMFLDQAQSTEEMGVFRLNIVKDGQIRPVTQEMVVIKVAGGVTIALRDISDPKNIVTYHLVSTPKDVSSPSQQSAVPSQVPDSNWIDKVVAFMSGAGKVQAAEPATPEQFASAIPLPSETPEPTAIPTPEPTILGADEQFGPPLQDALKAVGVTSIDCALPNATLWDALVKGGVMQQVKFLDQSFLNLLKRFIQADGTVTLPDAVTKFHCGFSQREDGVMEPQWYLVTEKGVTIFLLSDDGNTLIRGELRGGVPVPLLENGRVVVVTPPPSNGGVQPTPGGQEPTPVVNPPVEQPTPPSAGGYNFQHEGTQYVCQKCPWNESFLNGPNIQKIVLFTGDSATQSITNFLDNLSPELFSAELSRLKNEGYQPLSMNIWQAENIGDPAVVGIKPQVVWYYMQR